MKYSISFLTALLLAPLAALHASDSNPSVTPRDDTTGRVPGARAELEKGRSLPPRPPLRVADFGAVGDGVRDDGPAIAATFEAAKADGVPSIVVFEKKTYRLGDNPAAWHYFHLVGHEDLAIRWPDARDGQRWRAAFDTSLPAGGCTTGTF